MNWQKITQELINELGSMDKLCKLAMCTQRQIERVMRGQSPSYELGDRLIRMHDSMKEMRRK